MESVSEAKLAAIAGRLRDNLDALVDRIVAATTEELESYRSLPASDHRASVLANCERALDVTVAGRTALREELELARELGRRRGEQGIPVEDLLQSFRISYREGWRAWVAEAERNGLGLGVVLTASERLWPWVDEVMLAAAAAHRDSEVEQVAGRAREREEFLRAVLLGAAPAGFNAADRAAAFGIGESEPLFALSVRGDRPSAVFERQLAKALRRTARVSVVSVLDGHCAAVATERPRALEGATVGAGRAKGIAQLPDAFASATRAAAVGQILRPGEVVELSDLGLRAAVWRERALGEHLAAEYLGPIADLPRGGPGLEQTLRAYLEHDLRIEAAAAALFVHPNTLRHRLRRVEEATRRDLSRFESLVELWWALEWRALHRANGPP